MEGNNKNKLANRVDDISSSVWSQFDLIEEEIGLKLDGEGNDLRNGLKKRLDELRLLVESGEVNPFFDLNVNCDDDYAPVSRSVKVVVFPFAGNPPHWGHLSSALDALIQCKADKIVFVSNGNDFRKPDLLDVDIRYDLIRDVVSLFYPFFEFGDLAKDNFSGESLPLLGEYSIFRFLSLNPKSHIKAYYFAGSDHLHRTVVKDGVVQKDTIGLLEDNVSHKIFSFDSNYHEVVALISARDSLEYNEKIVKIVDPTIEIKRLDPAFSFSSTELRDALVGGGSRQALFFLLHVNLKKIRKNGWYR